MFEASEPPGSTRPPLAARMRPRNLDEYLGQSDVIGPGSMLRRALKEGRGFPSMLLCGPPGSGKTTLAHLIAKELNCRFATLSAVMDGVKQLREVVNQAKVEGQTLLFIDEIHRFNRSQQDALLPHVEDGTLLFIGATTENPHFEVNRALLSRSRVYHLKPLTRGDVLELLESALRDEERGFGGLEIEVKAEALSHLADQSQGDARTALNALELAVASAGYGSGGKLALDLKTAEDALGQKSLRYDKNRDHHYDVVSAFIKSVRGSDPDAALFWLAKMVLAGEDPKFIMRRLLILAAEDIGLADPSAITVVSACARALEWCGLPEGKYHLAMATTYLATANKSNTMKAYFQAEEAVKEARDDAVPVHLRQGARGKGYRYPFDYPGHYVRQSYLPKGELKTPFYQPSDQGYEQVISRRIAQKRGDGEPHDVRTK